MTDGPVYARSGEVITCTAGHRIGVLKCDVGSGTAAKSGDIAWEIEPAPKPGAAITPCSCGASYARMARGLQVFIDGAWRQSQKAA